MPWWPTRVWATYFAFGSVCLGFTRGIIPNFQVCISASSDYVIDVVNFFVNNAGHRSAVGFSNRFVISLLVFFRLGQALWGKINSILLNRRLFLQIKLFFRSKGLEPRCLNRKRIDSRLFFALGVFYRKKYIDYLLFFWFLIWVVNLGKS